MGRGAADTSGKGGWGRGGGVGDAAHGGGKQLTHRHQSFVFHHVRFNDVS